MIDDAFRRERAGVDDVEEGHFLLTRWRAGKIAIPIRIWFGPPNDPETGEPLDRSWRWNVEINGHDANDPQRPARIGDREVHDLVGIWPECKANPISAADYALTVAEAIWAESYDPRDPRGTISGRIDPMTASLPE